MSSTGQQSNPIIATSNPKKILLSTIGSRGDVQPILGLAMALKAIGHRPILAAGPNFEAFVQSHGIEFASYGINLRELEVRSGETPKKRTPEEKHKHNHDVMRIAYDDTYETAKDCDMILVGGSFHYAGHSIAEALNLPFVCMPFCTATIPSSSFPPARMILQHKHQAQKRPKSVNLSLWKDYLKLTNDKYLDAYNVQRARFDLAPIDDVHFHAIGDNPWLAADKTLGPAAKSRSLKINQIGAMLLNNDEPLCESIETFLQSGPPPIYIGFGSTLFPSPMSGQDLIDACRLAGHRAIIYRGWANLDAQTDDEDILFIGDHNQSKLFPRVAAAIHHGGAGTSTAAAIAGIPQVIVPYCYDQFYWGYRIKTLGIGTSCRNTFSISTDSLVGGIAEALQPQTIATAKEVSTLIDVDATINTAKLIDNLLQ